MWYLDSVLKKEVDVVDYNLEKVGAQIGIIIRILLDIVFVS